MASFVQTVLGRIEPSDLGFTLPHEHTRCVLWQIPARWDYWELTGEDELILPELARFRELGGTCLADSPFSRSGAIRCACAGWPRPRDCTWSWAAAGTGRRTTLPRRWLIADRWARSPTRSSVSSRRGPRERACVRAVIGEIGTDKPWLSAQEERVFRAVARASRATGMAVITHAVMSPVGLAQLAVLEDAGADPGRVVVGHADSFPDLAHHERIFERGASIECDFLGMSFTPQERLGEARLIRCCWSCSPAAAPTGSSSRRTSATTSSCATTRGTATRTSRRRSCPGSASGGVGEAEIRQMTVENPRRILAIGG